MIRVGFLFTFSKEYKGGINYLRNLFYATHLCDLKDIEYYIFVAPDIDRDILDMFSPYATIVETDILKKNTFSWFVNKIFSKLIKRPILLFNLLNNYKINVLSHSWFLQKNKSFKLLNWIPDFQNLHHPNLWPEKELISLNNFNIKLIEQSDRIILSSQDAFIDFKKIAPSQTHKVSVLPFVSQPGQLKNEDILKNTEIIKSKYGISDKYFYLPNQFWAHKNHIVVFKAINILARKGLNPILVTTGVMKDARSNDENIIKLNKYIDDNALNNNIHLLGIVPYEYVLTFMRNCISIINPSLFEGWSSTVEEAKSIGKNIILSDIGVHKEQNPKLAAYFDPYDEVSLATLMEEIWLNGVKNNDLSDQQLENDLITRTKEFGLNYYNILKNVVQ